MNINSVQNFSVSKNNKTNNTVTNPNFKANETVELPKKQMVNVQTVLANYTVKNMSFKGCNLQELQKSFFYDEDMEDYAVSMHHDINGINSRIRETYKDIMQGTIPSTKYKKLIMEGALMNMYEIDKEFAKLPPLEKECIVWRGRSENQMIKRWNADFEIIEIAQIGDKIIPDTGYSYAGFDRSLAEHWCNGFNTKNIMYKIILPKGSKVSRNNEHGGEVVMPRNAEYKLLSKKQDGNNTFVTLKYILPQKDNIEETIELLDKFDIEMEA